MPGRVTDKLPRDKMVLDLLVVLVSGGPHAEDPEQREFNRLAVKRAERWVKAHPNRRLR